LSLWYQLYLRVLLKAQMLLGARAPDFSHSVFPVAVSECSAGAFDDEVNVLHAVMRQVGRFKKEAKLTTEIMDS
jgi:hypothetical protein